jgi:RNA polymerase sigma-70 factor (ECF subfamily)
MAATTERATLVLDLFDRYYERVYAFLRKSTTPDVAEDLAQEVFLRLLQHPDLERLTISISYLLKIAHNLLRRRYARATRLRELLEERAQADDSLDSQTPGARRVAPEPTVGGDILETALGLLGKDEQDAIRLIVCEGKSYQHAAEALGVSVTTINNWKHRGIVKLRALVQGSVQANGHGASEGAGAGHGHETGAVQRPAARTVEISTQPVRLAPRRQGRTESEPATAGHNTSGLPGGGAASAMQRSLLAWRAAQDEVA